MSVLNQILTKKSDTSHNKGMDMANTIMSQEGSVLFVEHMKELDENKAKTLSTFKEKRDRSYYAGDTEMRYYFSDFNGMVYLIENNSNQISSYFIVAAYSGRKTKPDFYYRFKSLSLAVSYIEKWASSKYSKVIEKEERKVRQKELNSQVKDIVSIGDIFKASWGYEQTNIDYYQVIKLIGKRTAKLRKIASEMVDQSRGDHGQKIPLPNNFVGDEFSRQISVNQWSAGDNLSVSVGIDNVSTARLKPKNNDGSYESDYYSWGY